MIIGSFEEVLPVKTSVLLSRYEVLTAAFSDSITNHARYITAVQKNEMFKSTDFK